MKSGTAKLTLTLGKSGIVAAKNGFGALPIQRVDKESAAKILRRAFEGGINYFDTARSYSDSEEKLGCALEDVREEIFIATKTPSVTVEGFWNDLETSLEKLKTHYIDVYQFHNPPFCPKAGDGSGLYEAMLEAKAQKKIRHIGITNHRLAVAEEAVASGLYEILQFPFSYLSGPPEEALVRSCKEKGVGFVAMKALSGGLITNAAAAFAFMGERENVLPIWGVQRMEELEEFLAMDRNPPALKGELAGVVAADRGELSGMFCRGCGYCMPCPAGIEINNCARISLLLRRSPPAQWLTEEWQEKMQKIQGCLNCGHCRKRCPYGLDTPELLKINYEDYQTFLK